MLRPEIDRGVDIVRSTSLSLAAGMIAIFALLTAWSISLLPRAIDVKAIQKPFSSTSMLG
jgi:hypothetical protein